MLDEHRLHLLAVDACPFQPRPAVPEALWDSVLEQRRWHPWFGGATRDEFLAPVTSQPAPNLVPLAP